MTNDDDRLPTMITPLHDGTNQWRWDDGRFAEAPGEVPDMFDQLSDAKLHIEPVLSWPLDLSE